MARPGLVDLTTGRHARSVPGRSRSPLRLRSLRLGAFPDRCPTSANGAGQGSDQALAAEVRQALDGAWQLLASAVPGLPATWSELRPAHVELDGDWLDGGNG
jgi:hypothetical protein